MLRPASLLKPIALAAFIGVIVGVLMTVAGVFYAIARSSQQSTRSWHFFLKADPGVNPFTTFTTSKYATSIQIELYTPIAPGASFESIRLDQKPKKFLGLDFDVNVSPTLDDDWSRGLSQPMDTDEQRWKETVYGWPMRCFRVRGRNIFDGPPTTIPSRWAGVPGWSIAWVEAARSTAAFGVPTFAFVLPLMFAAGPIHRARRRQLGRCPACNYDLRGQPSPGCPECGAGRPPE